MVPKSQAIVGIEIGDLVVRAVQTDREASRVENYVEVAINSTNIGLTKPREPYQHAIDTALYQLDLGEPETYRLGVAFSDVNAGVGNGPAMQEWLNQQVKKLDVSFVYAGEPEVSFSPDGVVNDVLALFRPSGVAVSRMELSPVAAARSLPANTTGTVLIGSGIGWQVDLREGRVFSAYASDKIGRNQALRLLADGTEQPPLTNLRDIDVPDSLLAKHRIPIALLCPTVGVAKGVAEREAANLLYGSKVEAASELQRKAARKSTTEQVQAVPESVAIASQAVPTKTTMFQPLATGDHSELVKQLAISDPERLAELTPEPEPHSVQASRPVRVHTAAQTQKPEAQPTPAAKRAQAQRKRTAQPERASTTKPSMISQLLSAPVIGMVLVVLLLLALVALLLN